MRAPNRVGRSRVSDGGAQRKLLRKYGNFDPKLWPEAGKHIVVKLQISFTTPISMLIYDKNREWQMQQVAPKEILDMMNGTNKEFFTADLVPDKAKPGAYKFALKAKVIARDW